MENFVVPVKKEEVLVSRGFIDDVSNSISNIVFLLSNISRSFSGLNREENDGIKKMFFGDIYRRFDGITSNLRDINYKFKDLKKMEVLPVENDILSNIDEKLKSGFYLDKINIDGKFEIWKQEEKCLVLLCCNGKLDDGSDGLAVRLPLPLRFDEEWFQKYIKNKI